MPAPVIAALPTAPDIADPVNFASDASVFVAALAPLRTQINSFGTYLNSGIEFTSPFASIDINGGTVDGTPIGLTTPVSGTFTTLTSNNGLVYAKENILGTVSQTAGVPTGSVIQRGSNATGEFFRLADGTQICVFLQVPSAASDTTWTFPAAFSSTTTLGCVGNGRTGTDATFVSFRVPTATSVAYNHWTTAAARSNAAASLIAIGRWF